MQALASRVSIEACVMVRGGCEGEAYLDCLLFIFLDAYLVFYFYSTNYQLRLPTFP